MCALKNAQQSTQLPDTAEELSHFLDLHKQGNRYSDNDIRLIWIAYKFARSAHDEQSREIRGAVYFTSPGSGANPY